MRTTRHVIRVPVFRFVQSSASSVTCSPQVMAAQRLRFSLTQTFRTTTSGGGGRATTDPEALEALARARMAEAEQSMPKARTFTRGKEPSKEEIDAFLAVEQQQPQTGASSSSTTSTAAAAAPPPPVGGATHRGVERSVAGGASSDARDQTATASQQQQKPPKHDESASPAHPWTKAPVKENPGAQLDASLAAGPVGSSIMFDVPEGELPQQGSYNPWEVLGLKPGASAHDLRLRYHELLELYHPDYVKDGGEGNVQKWAEVDRAYQLVTKAPSHDKRYRNLMTDSQQFYYRVLPEWMAKNIDEMPRWWTWLRWRLPNVFLGVLTLVAVFGIGKMWSVYPVVSKMCLFALTFDIICHTSMFPVMFVILIMATAFSGRMYDLSWLTSPKSFLRRPLQY